MEGILWHMPIPFQNPHLTPPSLEINYHSLKTELNVFSEDMVDPDAGGVVDNKLAKNVGYTTKGDIFNYEGKKQYRYIRRGWEGWIPYMGMVGGSAVMGIFNLIGSLCYTLTRPDWPPFPTEKNRSAVK